MDDLRKFEVAIEKYHTAWRREFTGRGTNDATVRIVGDTILLITKFELTPLEKMNLDFIKQTTGRENEYRSFFEERVLESLKLTEVNFLLEIRDMTVRLEENGNYFIIRLKHNIEQLIESGVAVLPLIPG